MGKSGRQFRGQDKRQRGIASKRKWIDAAPMEQRPIIASAQQNPNLFRRPQPDNSQVRKTG